VPLLVRVPVAAEPGTFGLLMEKSSWFTPES
jgi:hypothetical protein